MKKKNALIFLLIIIVLIVIIVFAVYKTINNKQNKFGEVKGNAQRNEVINNQNVEIINDNNNSENETSTKYTTFKVREVSGQKGEELNVIIELLNDSNFVAANFEYTYDTEKMEYISCEKEKSFENAAMLLANEEDDKILIGYVANPGAEKEVKAGEIINLKFKIKDDISSDKINNKLECTTLKTEDGTDLDAEVKQGIIKIN